MALILDAAGFVIGTYDGPGQPANSTSVSPPTGAAVPLRFLAGAWVMRPTPRTDKNITRLAFLNRLTLQERVAIRAAAAEGELVVADILDLLNAASFIDLAGENTTTSVEYLREKTLLSSARANDILNAPILDAERPD